MLAQHRDVVSDIERSRLVAGAVHPNARPSTYASLNRYGASTGHDAFKGRHGNRNAVLRAHCLAQHSSTVSHLGGGGEVESAGECLSPGPSAIQGGRRDAGQAQAFGPKELVAGERGHDGRHARACGGVRGAGATVMDNRGGAREQPVVRRVADGEKIVRKRLGIDAAPAGMEQCASAGQRERAITCLAFER